MSVCVFNGGLSVTTWSLTGFGSFFVLECGLPDHQQGNETQFKINTRTLKNEKAQLLSDLIKCINLSKNRRCV